MGKHIPVLLNEVIEGLNILPSGIYFDLTLGRGGHSKEILKRLNSGHLYGVDQDETAIEESKNNLKDYLDKVTLVHANFSSLHEILNQYHIDYVDGILMDLGVSSPQFDEGDRGFSYKEDAPLDMRMDQNNPLSAKDIVNTYSLNELTRIFREYGEDKFSYQIAKNIIKEREKAPIETTFQLVEIIKRSKPAKELKKVGHPAKQVFQALRIEVNKELEVLQIALKEAIKALRPHGGRLAVITFQSLEDRIVKNIFKEMTVVVGNRYDDGQKLEEKEYRLVNNKPIVASEEELQINNRAHSAKLRIIERK
ncbi:MAG: 16S rRNA (cytosine(1402)-N(4))-methyltransferase RsmH [Bacilli bacterium]|nr:16S rRNA (cytosine(1402)-N(4))-methyltransferase RsmH [Bacilli bacterium]